MELDELLALADDAFVDAAFQAILGRPADQSGLDHYRERLLDGRSRASILYDIAQSREGKAFGRHEDLASLSDEAFVDAIYGRLLGRRPEPGGKRHYLYVLGHDGKRGDVIREIEESAESRKRNAVALDFKKDLRGLVEREGRLQGLLGRLRSWLRIRRTTVLTMERIDQAAKRQNDRLDAIVGRLEELANGVRRIEAQLSELKSTSVGLGGRPRLRETGERRSTGGGAVFDAASAGVWPTAGRDGRGGMTLDDVLANIRAEIESIHAES